MRCVVGQLGDSSRDVDSGVSHDELRRLVCWCAVRLVTDVAKDGKTTGGYGAEYAREIRRCLRVLNGMTPPYLNQLVPVSSLPGRRRLRSSFTVPSGWGRATAKKEPAAYVKGPLDLDSSLAFRPIIMKAKIIVTLYIKNVTGALYTVNYNENMSVSVSVNAAWNSVVLTARRNDCSEVAALTDEGRAFQARVAATGKARSPSVERRVDGRISVDVAADRRRRRTWTSADFWSVSARYCGAVPLRQRIVYR